MPAPDITVAKLAVALGVVGAEDAAIDDATRGILTRLLGVAAALVAQVAPEAPVHVANEAAVRIAAYQYDTDPAAPNRRADVLTASDARHSAAMTMCSITARLPRPSSRWPPRRRPAARGRRPRRAGRP